jgi:hypothetical protein
MPVNTTTALAVVGRDMQRQGDEDGAGSDSYEPVGVWLDATRTRRDAVGASEPVRAKRFQAGV